MSIREKGTGSVAGPRGARRKQGFPPDFWIGSALILASAFLFVLAAAGAFGEGSGRNEKTKARGKTPVPGGEEGKSEKGRKILDEARAPEKAGSRVEEALRKKEIDSVGGCIAKALALADEGRFGEAFEKLDATLESVRFDESIQPLQGARAEISRRRKEFDRPGDGSGPTVIVRKGAERIDLKVERVLILPVDTWAFYSLAMNRVKLSAALFTGCIEAFGAGGISLEPLRPALESAGLGATARQLANGAYQMIAFHNEFDLSKDTAPRKIREIPGLVSKLVELVSEKLDFEPRYVFALAITGLGRDKTADRLKYRVIACLYDLETKRVHSCTRFPGTVPMDKDAAWKEIVKIPKTAFEALMKRAGG